VTNPESRTSPAPPIPPRETLAPSRSAGGGARGSRAQSIQFRLLALLLALTLISVGTFAYLGVDAIQRAGRNSEETSSVTLRAQAREYLVQLTKASAEKHDLILQQVQHDAEILAQYAASVLDDTDAFAANEYRQNIDHMIIGPDGQYYNGPEDICSVFVPNFKERDDELLSVLAASAYLDFALRAAFDKDPNSVAVYLGTENEITRYYPNIELGEILPSDFKVTGRPWYVGAAPGQNPQRETFWSEVYEDATGKGLLVTAASPVYAGDTEFQGVIGIDVTLGGLRANIENTTPAGGGYLFLVDGEGRAIALPEKGYQDLIGRSPPTGSDEFVTPMSTAYTPFVTSILQPMLNGLTGFASLNLGGREFFVAYAPLESTGWSLGSVVQAEQLLVVIADMRAEIERSTNDLIVRRVVPAGAAILAVVLVVGLLLSRRLANPIQKLAAVAHQFGSGELDTVIPVAVGGLQGSAEINILAQALSDMREQIRELIGSLEQRVTERTQALENRARQLEAAAEVAHSATAMLDPQSLISRVVTLISERFGFYHAGIFLLDDAKEFAVLRAASSEGGQRMLAREHRLRVGQKGIVGYVTGMGNPRIALDVGEDAIFFENPDLPATRSEMALPLRARGEIIGALDVQSTEEAAFSEEDVAVLQTLADQVALAISNAQYYRAAQERLAELQRAYGEYSRRAWVEAEQAGETLGFRYTRQGTVPDPAVWNQEMARVLETGQPVYGLELATDQREPGSADGRPSALAIPITVHGQAIGVLYIRKAADNPQWRAEEVELIQSVVEQLGLTLESARLYQDAQRRAIHEQLISEITTRMHETLDVDTLLQTAVQEIGTALELHDVTIELQMEQE
jgi:GAF domain-containing protein/HAMP domain-containing protein